MKRVHKKNAFGRTETEIAFFEEGSIGLRDHQTPAKTYWGERPLYFSFSVVHDPFISYGDLDTGFEAVLEDYIQYI